MKGMASTPDYYIPPNEGPWPGTVIAAEACLSKKNNTQIKIQVQLDGSNDVIDDYIGTDGTVKGASLSKAKLRGLGVNVDSDAEVPDEQVAAELLGRKVIIEIAHENAQKRDEATNTYVNATHFDPRTNQTIQLKRAVAKGYRMTNVGAPMQATAPAPQYAQAAPQQFAQPMQAPPAQQFAPQQFQPQAQQPVQAPPQQVQFAQPGFQQQAPAPQQQYQQAPAQQFAQPQPPQAWMPPGQPAPQQYAPPQAQPQYQQPPQIPPQAAPVTFAPPAQPAPVPWANAAQPQAPAEEAPKRKRKSNITDEAQG